MRRRYIRYLTTYPLLTHIATGCGIYLSYDIFHHYHEKQRRKSQLKYLKSLPDMKAAEDYENEYLHAFVKENSLRKNPFKEIIPGIFWGCVMYYYYRFWSLPLFVHHGKRTTEIIIVLDLFVNPSLQYGWLIMLFDTLTMHRQYRMLVPSFQTSVKNNQNDNKTDPIPSRESLENWYLEYSLLSDRRNQAIVPGYFLHLWLSILNFSFIPSPFRGIIGMFQHLLYTVATDSSCRIRIGNLQTDLR